MSADQYKCPYCSQEIGVSQMLEHHNFFCSSKMHNSQYHSLQHLMETLSALGLLEKVKK